MYEVNGTYEMVPNENLSTPHHHLYHHNLVQHDNPLKILQSEYSSKIIRHSQRISHPERIYAKLGVKY